jgi:hypothetical protein
MRLEGRKEIMAYLKRNALSNRAWQKVRLRYKEAIKRDVKTGHVWTKTEWVDDEDLKMSMPAIQTCQAPHSAPP